MRHVRINQLRNNIIPAEDDHRIWTRIVRYYYTRWIILYLQPKGYHYQLLLSNVSEAAGGRSR